MGCVLSGVGLVALLLDIFRDYPVFRGGVGRNLGLAARSLGAAVRRWYGWRTGGHRIFLANDSLRAHQRSRPPAVPAIATFRRSLGRVGSRLASAPVTAGKTGFPCGNHRSDLRSKGEVVREMQQR